MKTHDELIFTLKPHAVRAAKHAHSPYSHFPVGAAVISRTGQIYAGCNVENASFGLTQCAERTALMTAVAEGAEPGSLDAVLIYTPGETAHSPCGACRQVMHELMTENYLVLSCCDGQQVRAWHDDACLPDPFDAGVLLS